MSQIRRYSEVKKLKSFEERYEYLRLVGTVGASTFGFDRFLNQALYRSKEWKNARNIVIVRDNACDLGIIGREIGYKIIIHHLNPISIEEIENGDENLFNPEFLICTSNDTHQAIHYGVSSLLLKLPIKRYPGDTCPWRKEIHE